ncbi:MAG: hypothetical protein ICV54_29805, partial [Nostoc sp. C3-bin3]|nr:hypothetical protein [Nostoc sp. C3-bin3]
PYSALPDSVIASEASDFSCYVIIDNTNGKSALSFDSSINIHGQYVSAPPKQIELGQQGKFWLQDYAGLVGSEGSVTYLAESQSLKLTYTCPTSWFNSCSGANFYTSNDGINWGELNQVKERGHPFFVKFIL